MDFYDVPLSASFSPIVRATRWRSYDWPCILLHGLNLFTVNNINVNERDDPRIIFFKSLINRYTSYIQIGLIATADITDNVSELFGPQESTLWNYSPVGVHGGSFYSYDDIKYDGVIHKSPLMLFDRIIDDTQAMSYLILCDAIAVYVNWNSAFDPDAMLPSGAKFDEQSWISDRLQQCSLIAVPSSDGSEINLITKSEDELRLVQDALKDAIDSVKSSEWYQNNERKLVWDSGPDHCLKLSI